MLRFLVCFVVDCGIRPNTKFEQRNLALFGDGTGGTHWSDPVSSSASASASASASEVEVSEEGSSGHSEQDDSDAVGSDDEGDDEFGGGEMHTDENQQVDLEALG